MDISKTQFNEDSILSYALSFAIQKHTLNNTQRTNKKYAKNSFLNCWFYLFFYFKVKSLFKYFGLNTRFEMSPLFVGHF